MTLLVALFACAPEPTNAPDEEAEPSPSVVHNTPPSEQELLAAGAPEPNGIDRAVAALATRLGMGAARCPAYGNGRTQRIHGSIRDMVLSRGPKLMVEVADDVPWNPIYDEIVVKENWTTFLVKPGDTKAYIKLGDRRLQFTFPEVQAGETVLCTGVETLETRVVKATVAPRKGPIAALGCTEQTSRVGGDGTLVIDATVPCSLWLEHPADGFRSAPVFVEPGASKVELELTLEKDQLQEKFRVWTDDGKAALQTVVTNAQLEYAQSTELFTKLEADLEGDDLALQRLGRWRAMFDLYQNKVGRIQKGLDGKIKL